ncbi:MAG: LytTR family DNA-binding domain-containing protein [Lentimicrobiaceae bacterium]|jgi:two-component system LytT family response regulator|nr:LytTR family DNA-binding domain-containing protein [Lentimicrobiaceae bacterium]
MIKLVIIDDEVRSRDSIHQMLDNYCNDVFVAGEAGSVKDGIRLIEEKSPDVVLLDIRLPDGSGFDLLRQIGKIDFGIIFITAYEEYAIKAFKFNAIDYILKPIDPSDLVNCIEKSKKVVERENIQDKLQILLDSLDMPSKEEKVIVLRTNDSVYPVNINDIIRCESERNYTYFYFTNGEKLLVSKSMREYADELVKHNFFRIHQSHVVNLRFIKRYNKEDATCILKDNSLVPVSWRKRDELLELFKKL